MRARGLFHEPQASLQGQLFQACENGSEREVRAVADALIQSGRVEHLFARFERYYDGWPRAYEITPFYATCEFGHLQCARYLAETIQVNVEARSSGGGTPFFAACCKGHLAIARYLQRAHRVDVNGATLDGTTPFLAACERGHIDIVKYLVEEAKADTTLCDSAGTCPLFASSWGGHLECVQYLLHSVRCGTESCNKFGWTALYIASRQGNMEVIRQLIAAGANVDVIDGNGRSAEDAARRAGQHEVSQLLLSIDSESALCAALQRLSFAKFLNPRLGGCSSATILPSRTDHGGDLHDLIASHFPRISPTKTVLRSMCSNNKCAR